MKQEEVKYLVEVDEGKLQAKDGNDEFSLHIACRNDSGAMISWIVDKTSN